MLKDPLLTWIGPFPYDIAAPFGITPDASRQMVKEGLSQLLAQLGPQVHQQAASLLQVAQRLELDFFLYHTPDEVLCARFTSQATPEL
jgi:hypothetical protein